MHEHRRAAERRQLPHGEEEIDAGGGASVSHAAELPLQPAARLHDLQAHVRRARASVCSRRE